MHGGDEKCIQNFGWKGKDNLEDLGTDGSSTLKWTLKKEVGCGLDSQAQDRDQCQVLVNMVMNLWVS
jgi:hypothetical protein